MRNEDKNSTVQIAGRIGASTIALVAINFIFARESALVSIYIVLFMVIFGVILAYLEHKSNNTKTKKK